ncbi:MAG: metal-sensing transcriptional repressor [Erysipelotrichales bacterium]|nr:metal-sensing transcriptional repressor [Erysipelotrichales bacterium]MBR3693261.1 metal-sensing transcriptional repressor [Erysipelotrichales bacterium]
MMADREKVERLLKTARGQIDGILRMIEEDRYCIDISNQIMAAQSILKKVNYEILSAHLLGCVKNADAEEYDSKIEELLSVMQSMSK